MIAAVFRKTRRLIGDPVLRRWVVGRVLGRVDGPPSFVAHRPPYLDGLAVEDGADPPGNMSFPFVAWASPVKPLELALPGLALILAPGDVESLFGRRFADTETLLAVHRFSWVPLAGASVDGDWVNALWGAWARRSAEPDGSWAWHPYTAAERAVNILDFAHTHGLPGPPDRTAQLLARHAAAIAGQLEYFGEHNTSNHLSSNGRGLYRIGIALGLSSARDLGCTILLNEAVRLFGPSGVLREGSTHYHLLVVRNYVDAWLAARQADRPEQGELRRIACRGLAAAAPLVLSGGLPLIGDISPDCPPGFLAGLLPGGDVASGWGALLDEDSRAALAALREEATASSLSLMAADGWIRRDHGLWSLLTHVPTDGWPPMPGHAHQDITSFELHYAGAPLIVDPGRGAYGETGEAAFYASAAPHNGLTIDGCEPYPPNKPYYSDNFRRTMCGSPPRVSNNGRELRIAHGGFGRVAMLGNVERCIVFDDDKVIVVDRIEGRGAHSVARRLTTPWPVEIVDGAALISCPAGKIRVGADTSPILAPATRWMAYGVRGPATAIEFPRRGILPARLELTIGRV